MNVYLLLPLHIIDLKVYRQTTLQLEVSNFFFNFEIIIFFCADFATATHISEECLCIPINFKVCLNQLVTRSFAQINQALCICPTTSTQITFLGSVCISFVCLAPMENKREMYFLRTQQRIASSGIEPRVGSLSIINLMLYQQNYRRRN